MPGVGLGLNLNNTEGRQHEAPEAPDGCVVRSAQTLPSSLGDQRATLPARTQPVDLVL